jgi:hypothetical protein
VRDPPPQRDPQGDRGNRRVGHTKKSRFPLFDDGSAAIAQARGNRRADSTPCNYRNTPCGHGAIFGVLFSW